jgi:hypothetical protein
MPFFDIISELFTKAQGIVTAIGLIITLIFSIVQQRRLVKVEKQQTYQRLELASNEVFRFTADHARVLAPYQAMEPDPSVDFEKPVADNTIAENHIYQTLNLFEMAARLRKEKFFEDEIFASWVIWYYEMLESWYFRHKWPEIRLNYTREMRCVFDEPIRRFHLHANDAARKEHFFTHVAKELKFTLKKKWLD